MQTEGQLILAMLSDVLRKLEALGAKPQGPLTRVAFGKLVKKSPRTIARWIEKKKILTKNDLIPFSETRKFLS